MTRPRALKTKKDLEEFNKKGFVEISNHGTTLKILRKEYGRYYRIFKSANKTKGAKVKYRTYDLFGCILNYYYDIRRKDEFVSFLLNRFKECNDDHDTNHGKRTALTMLLHEYSLDLPIEEGIDIQIEEGLDISIEENLDIPIEEDKD